MSMSTAPGGGSGGGGGVGGALSLMGCVREASPPPQNHHQHHHHHYYHQQQQQQQQQQQHRRIFGLAEFPMAQHNNVDPLPKEPKKRRFHPLRGLRKIFRRKSRGAADLRLVSTSGDRDAELARVPQEEITTRHPAGRHEEARSRSASELLTDSCDRESIFLRGGGAEDNFVKLRGGAGKLSVSHDSVFPGEVPHTRPLSSLASLATLERRQARKSAEIIEHKEYNNHHVAPRHRISLRVLEQIKTVIENRNQLASTTPPEASSVAHAVAGERYQQETTENRFSVFERHGERNGAEESQQAKGKLECRPIVSIGFLSKETILNKNESCARSRRTATTTTTTMPMSRTKSVPKVQRTSQGDNRTRIDITMIEDKIADASAVSVRSLYKIEDRGLRSKQPDVVAGVKIHRATRERTITSSRQQIRVDDAMIEVIDRSTTRSTKDTHDRTVPAREDLPQLESASLSHTAAHHRISVRPKNRRPPRRTVSTTALTTTTTTATTTTITATTPMTCNVPSSPSIPSTIAEDTLDSLELQQQLQQLPLSISNASSPTEAASKAVGVMRKSSSRQSRNSDIFEELESRLPRKASATSLSPDSLDVTTTSRSSTETPAAVDEQQQQPQQQAEVRWISVNRRPSNRISKGSDVFEELEAKLPRRRSSSNRLSKSPDSLDSAPGCWFSKSTDEGFDKLAEYEEVAKPTIAIRSSRPLLHPMSKSTDRVSKSSDSLEAIEPLVSDDSIERRRSSFDLRARRTSKAMSKSSESFDALEQSGCVSEVIGLQELQKRSSVSDINLSRVRRLSKSIFKSAESFERIDAGDVKGDVDGEAVLDDDPAPRANGRRSAKRMSSESSDNLDVEDRLENRRIRRTPKRIPSTSVVDVMSADDQEAERRPTPTRKPSRLQKSSESSELGSTDTLDSERRNKSSGSTETLDSLEKDLEQDRKDEEITDSVMDKRERNESWSGRNVAATDPDQTSMGDDTEDSKPLISADNKYYWRQSSEPVSKENLGIQQLLAITIMTRMADNGNNQRDSVIYPKKKQQMSTSQPTSPVAKQEDTKMLFDNLLVSKNDEDLQNMLNGNISEVSTDTKSFKEKLIMFEKLGK